MGIRFNCPLRALRLVSSNCESFYMYIYAHTTYFMDTRVYIIYLHTHRGYMEQVAYWHASQAYWSPHGEIPEDSGGAASREKICMRPRLEDSM